MITYKKPDGVLAAAAAEEARLEALYRYDILGSPQEENFDRITRLAKLVMKTPIAVISLIDRDRQWFKSAIGLSTRETPRNISFCSHAVEQGEPLIVCNALEHPLFCKNPLVTGAPHIRFYMGVPLRTYDNYCIGTLCIIDTVPRFPLPEQVAVMQDLAGLVVDELQLRQIADVDSLTGTMTRRSFTREAKRATGQALRNDTALACLVLDIDHFKMVNDTYGHGTGDLVLQAMARTCQAQLRATDVFGRLGGEEFAAILPDASADAALLVAERTLQEIAAATVGTQSGPVKLTVSIGMSNRNGRSISFDALLAEADAALYQAKRSGRNRVCVSGKTEASTVPFLADALAAPQPHMH